MMLAPIVFTNTNTNIKHEYEYKYKAIYNGFKNDSCYDLTGGKNLKIDEL